MFRYYNAHPRGLHTDDCVKRAISLATGKDYLSIQRELNQYKKITGAKKFNSDHNPHRYVEEVLKATKILPTSALTAAQFCAMYPRGRYILDLPSHWSCCINGNLLDTWDVSDQPVSFAYAVEPSVEPPHLRYCCTVKAISASDAQVRIYDGNGIFVARTVPAELVSGYIKCLEDFNYTYLDL